MYEKNVLQTSEDRQVDRLEFREAQHGPTWPKHPIGVLANQLECRRQILGGHMWAL